MFTLFAALGCMALAAVFMAGVAGFRDNYSGDVHIAAPSGGTTAGSCYAMGNTGIMVARETQAATVSTLFATRGPIWATKLSTDAFAVGDKVYADLTNHRVTATATSNTLIGVAVAAALSGDATVLVDWLALPPTAT